MPANFWERDAAYRKRIGLIVPIVLAAYTVLFLATDRIRYEDIPRFIGWRGELEILPEITVIPDVVSVAEEAAPPQNVPRETVALNLTTRGDVVEAPVAATTESPPPVPVVEPGLGHAPVRVMERSAKPRDTSYSDEFMLLRQVNPIYPLHERAEGIEGMVTVEMKVDELGLVSEANVLSIIGPDSFGDAALDAVRQFLFVPPTINGQPTTIWVRLRFKFRITG